ncbi:unnamed protein product [Prunus armeniaca]
MGEACLNLMGLLGTVSILEHLDGAQQEDFFYEDEGVGVVLELGQNECIILKKLAASSSHSNCLQLKIRSSCKRNDGIASRDRIDGAYHIAAAVM